MTRKGAGRAGGGLAKGREEGGRVDDSHSQLRVLKPLKRS